MKYIIYIFLINLPFLSISMAAKGTLKLSVRGQKVSFVLSEKGFPLYSENCRKNPNCQALKKFTQVRPPSIQPYNGNTSAALVCHNLNGHVVSGFFDNGNQMALCGFADQSYVDMAWLQKQLGFFFR